MKIRFKEIISNLVIYHYKIMDEGVFTNGRLIFKEEDDFKALSILNKNENIISKDFYSHYEKYSIFGLWMFKTFSWQIKINSLSLRIHNCYLKLFVN